MLTPHQAEVPPSPSTAIERWPSPQWSPNPMADPPFDVFLSGSWSDREHIANDCNVLTEQYELAVACSWAFIGYTEITVRLARRRCELEISQSRLFVLDLSRSPSTTGGRYTELGLAIALCTPVLCIGAHNPLAPYTNEFPHITPENRYDGIATAVVAAHQGPKAWREYCLENLAELFRASL
jgi:hypothetical protein